MSWDNLSNMFKSSKSKLIVRCNSLCLALVLMLSILIGNPINVQAGSISTSFESAIAILRSPENGIISSSLIASAAVAPEAAVETPEAKAAAKLEAKKAKAATKLEAKKLKEAAEAEAEAVKSAEKAAAKAAKLEAKKAKEATKLEAKKAKEAEKEAAKEAVEEKEKEESKAPVVETPTDSTESEPASEAVSP